MKQQPTKRVLSTEEVTLINERADAVFKAHPTVEQLYACIDGQLFFTKEKNAAENHARKLKQAELILVTKSEVGSPKTEVETKAETGDLQTGEKLAEAKSEVGSPKSEAEQPKEESAVDSVQSATDKTAEETTTKPTKDKKDKK